MKRTWNDPRDGKTWQITVDGRAAEVASGTRAQLLVFRGSHTSGFTVYDGDRELQELGDVELSSLLDAALGQPSS